MGVKIEGERWEETWAAQLAWEQLRNRIAEEAIEAWDRGSPPCPFCVFILRYARERLVEISRRN